jgi:3-hydroxyisobutyrate dehydrogenase
MGNPVHTAFIGLGNMGRAMATRLVRGGFDVTVWNRTAARADELVAAGAKRATTIADAARADVVITMVSPTTPRSRVFSSTASS